MHILVMGAGAVGGYFGGKLATSGKNVTFVARGAMLQVLREKGLRVTGKSSFAVRPARAVAVPSEAGLADLILVAVKCYDTREAAHAVSPCVGPNTAVLSIQNGVENEDILGELLGRERVLGGVSRVGAEVIAPGVVEHTHGGEITLGEMDGTQSARALEIARVLNEAGVKALLTGGIRAELWEKCAWNSSVNGITALTRRSPGEIASHRPTRELVRDMVVETAKVAQALGAPFNLGRMDQTFEFLEKVMTRTRTSTLQDLEKGKRIEFDGLNGAIVRAAEKHNVSVPLNRALWALLSLVDPGRQRAD
jgi:2-dehydropantoate 2-reductase